MSLLMYGSVGGAIVNLVLVGLLLFAYSSSYRQMRTGFTLGLLVFALFFLVQNLITLFSYVTMMSYYAAGVDLHVALFTWAQTAGLGVLVATTWK